MNRSAKVILSSKGNRSSGKILINSKASVNPNVLQPQSGTNQLSNNLPSYRFMQYVLLPYHLIAKTGEHAEDRSEEEYRIKEAIKA